MNKEHWVINTFFALLCATFLAKTSFAEPPNLSQLKAEVIAYHDSGAYEKELAVVINKADHYIVQQAMANQKKTHPAKLAIVLDIDETSLSNYDRLFSREFVGDRQRIHQDILAADAKAIPPMLGLYRDAQKYGVSVFFVTGRIPSEQEATCRNLTAVGYKNWAGIYFKPADYHETSNTPFKSRARAKIAQQGYQVIASIGDQYSDLKGGFADKTFKLPNPYYYLP